MTIPFPVSAAAGAARDPLLTLRTYHGLAPWSLRDLAAIAGTLLEASGVVPVNVAARARPSERTIRFYVMKGLVDPPEGRGDVLPGRVGRRVRLRRGGGQPARLPRGQAGHARHPGRRPPGGVAVEEVKDATGKVLVEPGKTIPGFATIAGAADPGTIACGCWIYSGYFHPADDGTGTLMPAAKRRGLKDPGGLGIYPFWGWAWPANRSILYNRASARPDGRPWSEDKKLIWWDAEAKKWAGYDVPDFPPTKAPNAAAVPGGVGLAAQSGTDAFLMKADGKGWLFAPKGMNDGPLPEHYEPVESPIRNPLTGVQWNPVVKVWTTDGDKDVGDRIGAADKFPIV